MVAESLSRMQKRISDSVSDSYQKFGVSKFWSRPCNYFKWILGARKAPRSLPPSSWGFPRKKMVRNFSHGTERESLTTSTKRSLPLLALAKSSLDAIRFVLMNSSVWLPARLQPQRTGLQFRGSPTYSPHISPSFWTPTLLVVSICVFKVCLTNAVTRSTSFIIWFFLLFGGGTWICPLG
jgi:hypothetical protein